MKIDTSSIEGFDGMTAEEKVEALSNFEYEVPADRSDEVKKQKELIDKYSSEIANLKKKAKEGLDENERAKQEVEDRISALEAENESLKKTQKIASLKASYLAMGYAEVLADEKAVAITEGDMDKVLDCENKYREAIEKAIRAEVMKGTGRPDFRGHSSDAMTREKLAKLNPAERFAYAKEHPDEYKQLYGGN